MGRIELSLISTSSNRLGDLEGLMSAGVSFDYGCCLEHVSAVELFSSFAE